MRITILLFQLMIGCSFIQAQTYQIEQYLPGTSKIKTIRNGDKVIISFNQLSSEVLNRPSKVFIGGNDTGSTNIFLKARITQITDSSIQFKDRVISGRREIRLSELTGIRKITFGKQVGRVALQGLGYTAIGLSFTEINGGSLWSFITLFVGGLGLVETAGNHFSKAYTNNWKIRVVKLANTNSH
jgi:hypothetical protein